LIKKRIDIAFTGSLLGLYLVCIAMDWFVPSWHTISAILKWSAIFLCALYVWVVSRDYLLQIALGMTLICELFLLFGTQEMAEWIGVALFCIVHVLYAIRMAPKYESGILIVFCFIAVGALIVYAVSSMLLVAQSALLSIGMCYSGLLMMNVVLSIQGMRRRWRPWPISFLCAISMLLLLVCDIVALAGNIDRFLIFHRVVYAHAGKVIWVFYLPAQWLMAKSAFNLRKKLA